jgi:hypothetical protein
MQASYLEGSIFDQLFQHPEGYSLSAMNTLIEANREQIPIQRITTANIDAVLPGLAVGSEVRDDVSNAIQAGKIALVSQLEITHRSWKGSGYILQDPATGAAAYKLGSANGGTEQPCQTRLTPQQTQEIITHLAGMLDGLVNGWISGPGAAGEAAVPYHVTAATGLDQTFSGVPAGMLPILTAVSSFLDIATAIHMAMLEMSLVIRAIA